MNETFIRSANTGASICWSPLENFVYEFVFTSVAVLRMYCSSFWVVFETRRKSPYNCDLFLRAASRQGQPLTNLIYCFQMGPATKRAPR